MFPGRRGKICLLVVNSLRGSSGVSPCGLRQERESRKTRLRVQICLRPCIWAEPARLGTTSRTCGHETSSSHRQSHGGKRKPKREHTKVRYAVLTITKVVEVLQKQRQNTSFFTKKIIAISKNAVKPKFKTTKS